MKALATILGLLLLAPGARSQAEAVDAEFTTGAVRVDGRDYAFRRLAPLPQWRLGPQPLVVFLHGAGERGTENLQQLAWLPRVLAQPENRQRFPCHLVAVQCPPGEAWGDLTSHGIAPRTLASPPSPALRAVITALDLLVQEPGVDGARVYLTGLSMGGYGAWELAARHPERFAALLPVCGGGDPSTAARLFGLPTLVYHGAEDTVVPPAASRAMVGAMHAIGVPVDYRELAGVGHDAWRMAYRPDTGLSWLFAHDQRQQQRGKFAVPPLLPTVDAAVVRAGTFELRAGSRCLCPRPQQRAALLLLDALALPAAARPGLLAAGEGRPGDLEFAIDPALPGVFALDVGERFRVVGRDDAALVRAAAAAWQALATLPDLRCPRGRFVRTAPLAGGAVSLGGTGADWTLGDLLAAVRECWRFHADTLLFAGATRLDWLSEPERQRVADEAVRHGVLLREPDDDRRRPHIAQFDLEPADIETVDLARLLQGPVPPAAGPVPFVLRLPPLAPSRALQVLRTHLPAAAERADRAPDTVHVGSFLSRLGQLLRS